MYFQNYGLRKRWLCKCVKNPRFRRRFNKQHAKWFQTLTKSSKQHLQYFYWQILTTYSFKKSFFMICKTLGPFFNTLTSIVTSSLLNIDNLTKPIHIQLSRKQKTLF